MRKKILVVAITVFMVLAPWVAPDGKLSPVPVLGEGEAVLHVLDFDKIDEDILTRNSTVKTTNNFISSTGYAFDTKREAAQKQMDTALYDGLLAGLPSLAQAESDVAAKEAQLANVTDASLIADLKSQIVDMQTQIFQINYYNMQKTVVAQQSAAMASWASDLETDKSQAVQKGFLSSAMMKDLQIWAAQNYYIAYHDQLLNQKMFEENRTLVVKNLNLMRVRQRRGMVTAQDVQGVANQSSDLDKTGKHIDDGQAGILGELNLMLDQPYDTALALGEFPTLDTEKIKAMNYEDDWQTALSRSFNVNLQFNTVAIKDTALDRASGAAHDQASVDLNSEKLKLEDEKKKLAKAFDRAFNDVKDRQTDLQTAKDKLVYEKGKYDISNLTYSLGMIAKIEFDSATAAYHKAENDVKLAEHNLFKAYTAYDWMLKGLNTVSTGGDAIISDSATASPA